ncbi:alpha/beta hydrolase [Streptomyces canus]|uniref:alpha/beta hydrolase n=1 Tax=Streptomyces canus TaxID=58343 RepID=UPI0036D12936
MDRINSGVDFVRGNYDDLPAALREDFDVFGHDVRGVGRSIQVVCWDHATYTKAISATKGSAPILVIGNTGDPDTPYQNAAAPSRELDNGRLLTFKAEGHTAFGRSACATDAIIGYLVDLKVPARGASCADETQPPSAEPTVAPPGTRLTELRNGVNERIDRIGSLR